jgi:hypothetical protein
MHSDLCLHVRCHAVFLNLLLRCYFNAGHVCFFPQISHPFLQYWVTDAAHKTYIKWNENVGWACTRVLDQWTPWHRAHHPSLVFWPSMPHIYLDTMFPHEGFMPFSSASTGKCWENTLKLVTATSIHHIPNSSFCHLIPYVKKSRNQSKLHRKV